MGLPEKQHQEMHLPRDPTSAIDSAPSCSVFMLSLERHITDILAFQELILQNLILTVILRNQTKRVCTLTTRATLPESQKTFSPV